MKALERVPEAVPPPHRSTAVLPLKGLTDRDGRLGWGAGFEPSAGVTDPTFARSLK